VSDKIHNQSKISANLQYNSLQPFQPSQFAVLFMFKVSKRFGKSWT
jgi:hypothetical protein